jgi:phosphoribosylglycinamide formyltransferase 1
VKLTTKMGVLLSAGGSAFFEAMRIADPNPSDLFVLTDRPCAALAECERRDVPHAQVSYRSCNEFSDQASALLASNGVETCVLMFSRIIGASLYMRMNCMNVHPSLLPLFPGLSPLTQMMNSGAKFVGATLHRVDESVDGGAIISQTASTFDPTLQLADLKRVSFLQKTLLMLKAFEILAGRSTQRCSPRMNPTLEVSGLIEGFLHLQSRMGHDVFP